MLKSVKETRRDNLAALIEQAGGLAKLGAAAGISADYVWQLSRGKAGGGRDMGDKTARRIETAFGLLPMQLDHPSTPTTTAPKLAVSIANSETPHGYIRLPQYAVTASAGSGAVVDDGDSEVVRFLDVAEWWAQANLPRDTDRVKILSVRGDSMAPDIQHGDVLFVDTGTRDFTAPGLYVLHWQGRALVKRLVPELANDRLAIVSSNPAYPTEYVDSRSIHSLHIGGRVAAWWTLRKF